MLDKVLAVGADCNQDPSFAVKKAFGAFERRQRCGIASLGSRTEQNNDQVMAGEFVNRDEIAGVCGRRRRKPWRRFAHTDHRNKGSHI
jgi:hypothetical protein